MHSNVGQWDWVVITGYDSVFLYVQLHLFHESVFFVATSILNVSQFVKLLWFMSLYYEILIVVLSFLSAVTSAFQLFTC